MRIIDSISVWEREKACAGRGCGRKREFKRSPWRGSGGHIGRIAGGNRAGRCRQPLSDSGGNDKTGLSGNAAGACGCGRRRLWFDGYGTYSGTGVLLFCKRSGSDAGSEAPESLPLCGGG